MIWEMVLKREGAGSSFGSSTSMSRGAFSGLGSGLFEPELDDADEPIETEVSVGMIVDIILILH